MTPELIENAEMVSEQLAIATDTQQEAGLLPLDLNSTNSIVSQVRTHFRLIHIIFMLRPL